MISCEHCPGRVVVVEDFIAGEGLVTERRCLNCGRTPADEARALRAAAEAFEATQHRSDGFRRRQPSTRGVAL